MSDKLIKAMVEMGQIRIIACDTTELVKEATRIHECSGTASAALGRMLTAGVLMGSMLKSDSDVLTLKISGGGEARGVLVTAYSNGWVKGLIGNPQVELKPNNKGKFDVGGAIGLNGEFTVIKDLGLKEPYIGRVPIQTGEIGEDIAYYFTLSEQTPSAVALGVNVEKNLTVNAAGGFIIQMMPGADPLLADLITYRLEDMKVVTEQLLSGKTIEDIISDLFEDMEIKFLESSVPRYKCDCSRDKVEKAFISIGIDELKAIYDEGKTEELKCHFCNKSYDFTSEEIGHMIENLSK